MNKPPDMSCSGCYGHGPCVNPKRHSLKQVRRSDLLGLPSEVVDLIALGVYSLYTIRGIDCYLMITNTDEKWILVKEWNGAPMCPADEWQAWDELEQACIIVDEPRDSEKPDNQD